METPRGLKPVGASRGGDAVLPQSVGRVTTVAGPNGHADTLALMDAPL